MVFKVKNSPVVNLLVFMTECLFSEFYGEIFKGNGNHLFFASSEGNEVPRSKPNLDICVEN